MSCPRLQYRTAFLEALSSESSGHLPLTPTAAVRRRLLINTCVPPRRAHHETSTPASARRSCRP
jgi:hypothetical protein